MSAACGLGGDNDVQRRNAAMKNSETLRQIQSDMRHESALGGIYKKMGRSLAPVERVIGVLQVCDVSPEVINGFLITGDKRIRVRFEDGAIGPLPVLRRDVDALLASGGTALCDARIPVWITGRPWVEGEGHIVLLVRRFGLRVDRRGE